MTHDDAELKKGSTPLLILAVLQGSPLHGYAIAREIERRCADALKVGEGALYPALRALEREGLVEIYTLTDAGHAKLAASLKSWQRFSTAVNAVLGDTANGGTPHVQPV